MMSKMLANVLKHITFDEKIKNKVNIFYYNYFSKSNKFHHMIFKGCILVYDKNNILEKIVFLFLKDNIVKKHILVI